MRQTLKILITGGAILSSTLVLTGCAYEASSSSISASPTKTSTTVSKPKISSTPTSSSTPSNEPLTAEAMDKTCEDVFPLNRLYEFDSNLGLIPGQSPTVSPTAQAQIALGGVSCALTNLSSGATTEVIITKLTEKSAAMKKKEINSLEAQGSYQVETGLTASYANNTGQFVNNNYWVSVASANFANGLDASRISFLTAQGLQ